MLRMKNKPGNCHGFTLVELLVTLSLTAMVIATLGSFFLNHLRSYQQAVEDISVQDQVKAVTNLFMEKAMETKGIIELSLPGENPYIVKLDKNDSTPLIPLSIIFSYDPTLRQLKWVDGGVTKIVSGKITAFEVSPMEKDGTTVDVDHLAQASMAKVKITVSGTDSGIPGPPKEVTLNNSLRFRNYAGP